MQHKTTNQGEKVREEEEEEETTRRIRHGSIMMLLACAQQNSLTHIRFDPGGCVDVPTGYTHTHKQWGNSLSLSLIEIEILLVFMF